MGSCERTVGQKLPKCEWYAACETNADLRAFSTCFQQLSKTQLFLLAFNIRSYVTQTIFFTIHSFTTLYSGTTQQVFQWGWGDLKKNAGACLRIFIYNLAVPVISNCLHKKQIISQLPSENRVFDVSTNIFKHEPQHNNAPGNILK